MASVGSPGTPGSGVAGHIADHAKIKAFLDAVGDDPVAPPSGAAGGALNGSFPNPGIGASVGHAQVNPADPFLEADVQLASDAGPTTPSRRSAMYRCAVGNWRVDARPVANTIIPSSGYVNLLMCNPIWVPTQETWDQIGFTIAAAGAGTRTFRTGIYADNGDGQPGSLVYDGGTKNLTATGTAAWTTATDGTWSAVTGYTTATKGQVAAGLYWLALVLQSTPSTYPNLWLTTTATQFMGGATNPTPSGVAWTQAGVSGALPSTGSGMGPNPAANGAYVCGARVASRP